MLAKDRTRPMGVPLIVADDGQPASEREQRNVVLSHVFLAGHNIEYNSQSRLLKLAGEEITPEAWLELRFRVDSLLMHAGVFAKGQDVAKGKSSSFLTNNHVAIHKLPRGRLKKAPWWLKWLFDAVVTKEELGG
jgi:hypothetical protein